MRAARVWLPGLVLYVSHLPDRKGGDWGYDNDPKKAIDLSPYWARRFHAMCRYVNAVSWSF